MFLFRCKCHLYFLQELIMHMEVKVPYKGDPFDTEMSLQGLLLCPTVLVH